MESNKILEGLNNKQREAVSAPRSNLLILAGAGSGKTRILVHRIAWLISIDHCSPNSILAVTFTNKAVMEIKNRINKLIDFKNQMWIGTFHSLAHRILRIHHVEAHLPRNFQILDSEDQLRFIKSLIKNMNFDEKKWPANRAMWYINSKKDAGLRPNSIDQSNLKDRIWAHIYQEYQEACNRIGLVDFAEIILRSYELWLNQPNILLSYQKRFSNILVDEFQDTNNIQYEWTRVLAGKNSSVIIVGDDDQSIYGWRGAQVKNIQRFLIDFPNPEIIRLEQNYRSTNKILQTANTLIANNSVRLGKKLWTDSKDGAPVYIYCAVNEMDEANFVTNSIKSLYESNCAILYRSNAQSRVLEEALLYKKIPYIIYGGMRFFERQEIKDVIAYLRIIDNNNDDIAFERIINTPQRGIGERTMNIIREFSKKQKLTLWQAANILIESKSLTKRASLSLVCFFDLIHHLTTTTTGLSLYMQTDKVIKDSGLWSMYEQEIGKSHDRIENLKELVNATQQFRYDDENLTPLQAFLAYSILEEDKNQINKCKNNVVQLMTLHAAKGLEFYHVYIVGMEEGMLPTRMSMSENNMIEEERRLAYVGITRAISKLTLTYTKTRRLYGKEIYCRPSRFIKELPFDCIEKIYTYKK
ncbi:DNA helicase II [Candidatus Pantoea edessiphila]|uniref:DNA 3'-5' helicase n=1 Tax=Candidatus Pantoea edessiphila TaxID=2044610 RepID=A0A2P5SVB9_9GAMM|nr:DNA helicase II [Candidatus Pantoea edessiphila]PPI86276.1 DNA helicase II [Candidatus Pantoea edessiphila]